MKTLLLLLFVVTISSCSTAKKSLVGYWYKPKTMISVRFNPNKTFEFTDYDSVANRSQKFTGNYKLQDNNVILEYADKTTQTLSFEKVPNESNRYQLKKDGYYLIKDERVNNAVPPDSTLK